MFDQSRNCNNYVFFSGINTLRTVLNDKSVINKITTLNKRNKTDKIMSFGFQLFTLKFTNFYDLVTTQRFGNTFCFIDDVTITNEGGEFEKGFREIYPPELVLRKKNTSPVEASLFYLNIKISNKKCILGRYVILDLFLLFH